MSLMSWMLTASPLQSAHVRSLTAEGLLSFSATQGKTTLSDSAAIAKAHEAKATKVHLNHTHTKAWFGLIAATQTPMYSFCLELKVR